MLLENKTQLPVPVVNPGLETDEILYIFFEPFASLPHSSRSQTRPWYLVDDVNGGLSSLQSLGH